MHAPATASTAIGLGRSKRPWAVPTTRTPQQPAHQLGVQRLTDRPRQGMDAGLQREVGVQQTGTDKAGPRQTLQLGQQV